LYFTTRYTGVVVPADVGHLLKRLLFAAEVPDGKFPKVETEVYDDGAQTIL